MDTTAIAAIAPGTADMNEMTFLEAPTLSDRTVFGFDDPSLTLPNFARGLGLSITTADRVGQFVTQKIDQARGNPPQDYWCRMNASTVGRCGGATVFGVMCFLGMPTGLGLGIVLDAFSWNFRKAKSLRAWVNKRPRSRLSTKASFEHVPR